MKNEKSEKHSPDLLSGPHFSLLLSFLVFSDKTDKLIHCAADDLCFFPYDHSSRLHLRRQRDVFQTVKMILEPEAERHSDLLFHHDRHVVDQIISACNMYPVIIFYKPAFQFVLDKRALRQKYRDIQQILRTDGAFFQPAWNLPMISASSRTLFVSPLPTAILPETTSSPRLNSISVLSASWTSS